MCGTSGNSDPRCNPCPVTPVTDSDLRCMHTDLGTLISGNPQGFSESYTVERVPGDLRRISLLAGTACDSRRGLYFLLLPRYTRPSYPHKDPTT